MKHQTQKERTFDIWLFRFYIGINTCSVCRDFQRGSFGFVVYYNYQYNMYENILTIQRHGRSISIGR